MWVVGRSNNGMNNPIFTLNCLASCCCCRQYSYNQSMMMMMMMTIIIIIRCLFRVHNWSLKHTKKLVNGRLQGLTLLERFCPRVPFGSTDSSRSWQNVVYTVNCSRGFSQYFTQNTVCLHYKHEWTWSTNFSKYPQYKMLPKSVHWRAKLFQADVRTWRSWRSHFAVFWTYLNMRYLIWKCVVLLWIIMAI